MALSKAFAAAKREVEALGLTISFDRDYEEYRVTIPNAADPEAIACYTNDLEDAVGTAKAMAKAQRELAEKAKRNVTETWNTGRMYQRDGQIIIATWSADDGVVTFNDVSRMITGQLKETILDRPRSLRDTVMSAYDHGRYAPSRRAWQDGMMTTGCNAPKQGAAA